MAREVLVRNLITQEMIDAGADLLRRLDEAGLPVDVALWLFLPEKNRWRLTIASPEVSHPGPRSVYKRIRQVVDATPEGQPVLELFDITAADSNDPLMAALRKAAWLRGKTGVRLTSGGVDGHFIEDSYIYRTARPSQ